jgi:hypothetical protein
MINKICMDAWRYEIYLRVFKLDISPRAHVLFSIFFFTPFFVLQKLYHNLFTSTNKQHYSVSSSWFAIAVGVVFSILSLSRSSALFYGRNSLDQSVACVPVIYLAAPVASLFFPSRATLVHERRVTGRSPSKGAKNRQIATNKLNSSLTRVFRSYLPAITFSLNVSSTCNNQI